MDRATRRMRRFSIGTSLAGVLMLAALVLLPGPRSVISSAVGAVGWRVAAPGTLPAPWVEPGYARTPAPERTDDGYRWAAGGRAVLTLPVELTGSGAAPRPVRVVIETDSATRVSWIEPSPDGPVRHTLDENYDGFWVPDPRLALLPDGVDTLYVEAGGDWSIDMRALEPIPVTAVPVDEEMRFLGEDFEYFARGEGPGVVRSEDCSLAPVWDWSQFGPEQDLPYMALYHEDEDGLLVTVDSERDLGCSRNPGPVWVQVDTPDSWGLEFLRMR